MISRRQRPDRSDSLDRVQDTAGIPRPSNLGVLLWVLVLAGYPLVGILLAYTDLRSTNLTYPYRALVFVLAIVVIAGALLKRRGGRLDVLVTAFFLIYAFRLLYDWVFAGITGADRALIFFLVVVLVPVVATMYSGVNRLHDSTFAKPLMLVALTVLVLATVAHQFNLGFNPWAVYGVETTRLGFQAVNPISLGHLTGTSLICSFYLLHETRPRMYMRIVAWSGVFLGGFIMVLANSRGPIVATGLALAWFYFARLKHVAYVMPILLVLPIVFASDTILVAHVIERFSLDATLDTSGIGRLMAQKLAIEAFLDSPIVGAYYIDPRLGAGGYPHNIIIETAMALGIPGLIMMFVMLIRSAKNVLLYYNAEHPLQVMLLAQYFVGSQLSGALWGTDAFFMLLTMCLTARPSSYLK